MMDALLEIHDLHLELRNTPGKIQALNGIDFEVQPGEFFGVVGETGCGKTVTGLSVLRLLPRTAEITAGAIRFDDIDLLAVSRGEMAHIRGGRIAMIFQDPATSLNPVISIGAQLTRVIRRHTGGTVRQIHRRGR